MTQYSDFNKGVLFPERDKQTQRHPDYTGKIDVNGKVYRLAAWEKAKGVLSISLSEFNAEQHARTEPQGSQQPPLDDDIEF